MSATKWELVSVKYSQRITVKANGTITAGAPVVEITDGGADDGQVKIAADGECPFAVMVQDATDGDEKFAELLIPGQIWDVPFTAVAVTRGHLVTATGSDNQVDAGASTDDAVGRVVNNDVGATDGHGQIRICKSHIEIA